jgi:hypothetical protein
LVNAQETIDIPSLIKEISVNKEPQAMLGYTYKMEFVRQRKSFFGKNKLVKRFEAILPFQVPKNFFYKHPMLLVYDSSKSLTPREIVENRKTMVKELQALENPGEKKLNNLVRKPEAYVSLRADSGEENKLKLVVDLLELIENSKFSNPKRLEIDGRKFISVEFRPVTGRKVDEGLFYLELIEGLIYIDEEDKRIVEVLGYPPGKIKDYRELSIGEQRKFINFHYLQTRVADKHWFPGKVTLNFIKDDEIFGEIGLRMEFTFSDYRRSQVGVSSSKVNPDQEEN